MTDKHNLKQKYCLIITVILGVIMTGCAGDMALKKDPFFKKWETMAKSSIGYSPISVKKDIDISGEDIKSGIVKKKPNVQEEKELPKEKIYLTLKKPQDIKTVLRLFAHIAGQNMLIKDDIKGEIYCDFKGVSWDQAFRSILQNYRLDYKWEGEIIRIITQDDKEKEQKIKSIEDKITKVIPISYADPKKLEENIKEFLRQTEEKDKSRGYVRLDEHSNSLIIHVVQDDLWKIISLIEEIDKPTPQILIKANIVEATQDTARNLGIQWGGMYRKQRIGDDTLWITPGGTIPITSGVMGTPAPMTGGYNPSSGSGGIGGQGFVSNFPAALSSTASGTLGLLFGTLDGNILDMQLSALQSEGKLNILSSPSITTLDSQTAYTENGEKVPYVIEDVSSTGTITRSVKFEDVVLRLEIKPHVIDSKNLKMEILVKKNEVDSSRSVLGNPYIIKKETKTNLIVKDGETIVISGLTKQKKINDGSGVPGFKDIPLLGWLFKGEGKSESMEDVLIFITPTILPVQTAAAVTEKPAK